MKDKLDRLFADKLKGHTVPPSPQAWEQLHRGLAAGRRKLWLRRLAVAAGVALLFAVAYSLTQVQDEALPEAPVAQSMEKQSFSHENMPGGPEEAVPEKKATGNVQREKEKENSAVTAAPAEQEVMRLAGKSSLSHEPVLAAVQTDDEKSPVSHGKKLIIVLGEQDGAGQGSTTPEAGEQGKNEAPDSEAHLAQAEKTTREQKVERIVVVYKVSRRAQAKRKPAQKVLDNSLGKLAEFYDKKVMTDEVKADLNTLKKDVLAWRVDKLFSKKSD